MADKKTVSSEEVKCGVCGFSFSLLPVQTKFCPDCGTKRLVKEESLSELMAARVAVPELIYDATKMKSSCFRLTQHEAGFLYVRTFSQKGTAPDQHDKMWGTRLQHLLTPAAQISGAAPPRIAINRSYMFAPMHLPFTWEKMQLYSSQTRGKATPGGITVPDMLHKTSELTCPLLALCQIPHAIRGPTEPQDLCVAECLSTLIRIFYEKRIKDPSCGEAFDVLLDPSLQHMPKVWNATYDAYEPTNSAPIAISFRLHEEKYYEEMAVEIYKAEKVNPSAYGHTGLKPEEIIEKYRKILSAQDYHSRESQKDLERALSKLPSTFYFAPNLGEAFKNTEELSALCDPKEGQRTEWERHAHLFSIRNKKILVLDEWAEVTIKRAHQITCAAVAESREVLNTTAGDKK